MTGPTLSVITPVLDGADVLERCVSAVRTAGATSIQHIVVDDGSTDGSAALAADLGAEVLTIGRRGPSAARNLGVSHARGSWLAFVDVDDRPLAGWSDQVAGWSDDVAVVTVGAAIVRPDGHHVVPAPRLGPSSAGVTAGFLPGTFFVRRRAFDDVGGYDESLRFSENTDLAWRLGDESARQGWTVANIDETLFELDKPVDDLVRHARYVGVRGDAARRLLRKHPARFAVDRPGARRYWRIIAVDHRARGQYGRAAAAAVRSLVRR